ncbi:hypothetical protein IW01_19840 [Pectobacterium brasiliense]|nr:hypothetical protein IW01_19840 [Pectobacterium brasiliense]
MKTYIINGSEVSRLSVAIHESLPQNLRTLSVSYNSLTTLPESLPQNLRTLSVSYNSLTTLPESLPQNLRTLSVSYNSLTMLPDTRPQSLKTLNVKNNPLTTQRRELTMTSERRSSYTFKPYQRRPGARDIRQ